MKIIIISIFLFFIGYSIVGLFVEIPKVFNNFFYGIISLMAVYFAFFYLDLQRGIKEKFRQNKKNYEDKKTLKN